MLLGLYASRAASNFASCKNMKPIGPGEDLQICFEMLTAKTMSCFLAYTPYKGTNWQPKQLSPSQHLKAVRVWKFQLQLFQI